MKVYIGPPNHWFRPYQWAKRLLSRLYGLSDDKFELKTYEKTVALSRRWFGCLRWLEQRVDAMYTQKIKVRVDYYDTWSVDSTLAPIILPLLKQLQTTKHGFPFTDDEDVPEELRSTAAKPLTEDEKDMGSVDSNHDKRWQWILNEMIWSFEQLNDPDSDKQFWGGFDETAKDTGSGFRRLKCDYDGLKAHEERIRRGTTLFGKYYQSLWD